MTTTFRRTRLGLFVPGGTPPPPSAYATEVAADTPLGWWRQGEASGTDMADASGNGRDGVYSGGRTLGSTGLIPGDPATSVDYSGGQGVVPYDAAFDGGTSFAVDCLIKPDSVAGGSFNFIMNAADNGTMGPWWLILNAGHAEFALATGGGGLLQVTGATTIAAGTEYHIAGTYDGAHAKVFVDGVQDASAAKTGSLNVTAHDLWVGNWSTSPLTFLGSIQEAAIYAALTSTRVAAHAAAAGF